MWKNILLFISLSGLLGHHASPITKLYHFVNQKMTWTDAQRHCREQFDDLATVDNLEELKRLQESTSGFSNVEDMWIGLYDDLNRWQWSHGNQDYKMGQHYGNWRPGEPDYKNGKENCTMMTKSTGQWVDSACNLPLSAVCCNDEGNFFYVPNQMTWYDARQYCQSHYTELASVSDVTENGKIFALLESDAWIGLHRHPWSHWSDGSRATYYNWLKNQPSNNNNKQHCAIMEFTTAGFRDKSCVTLNYVACQERQKQRSTFRLKISSEADMTDPEVQRQLLEQVGRVLRMWKNIQLFLSLSGLLGHHASPITKLYHFVHQKMTWTDAQRHCREQFDDLATVDNLEELKRLQESKSGFGKVGKIWIGLYDDLNRWQWSHGNQDYKMGQHYGNWRPGEPDYMYAKENCTMMTKSTGQWVDSACNLPLSAVCCNDEGNFFYVPNQMTWYDARQYCQSHYTELASVSDVTENSKIFALLESDAWIGLHRHPWSHWSDGSRATYYNWLTNQPSNFNGEQYCAIMEFTTAGFTDRNCVTLNYFTCQERQKQRSTFRLKISSEADMTDPEVQRQLLEQLYAKLANKGVTGVKLSWVLKDGQDQQSKK
ncbi:Macrophage mannose receptor 1 [Merluccius polli]|uniref:Macrophage mannose receptor 1 n=1 Tax=Merluccius polli TaxID=89951 RepID=A0AA47NQU7_MERPO|nr:Macrophage mannose receptor 1 [Merluccius polli]